MATLVELAKQLKDVTDAIDRSSKLETDLQQHLSKVEGAQRTEVAKQLANLIAARENLSAKRAEILADLSRTP
jgi:hypothetical protein